MTTASSSAPYPMTYEQESIWLNDQLHDGASRYVESWNHRLRGPLDHRAVETALTGIVERHATLRSRLALEDGRAVQYEEAPRPVSVDKRTVLPGELDRALREAVRGPLDLTRPPLLRATLLHVGPQDAVLAVALHHALVDGWCFRLLDLEFSARYRAALAGEQPELPPLEKTFADYAREQRSRPAAHHGELLGHWRRVLAGAPAQSTVPSARRRPDVPDHRGGQVRFRIGSDTGRRIRELARLHRTSTFSVLAACLTALVARSSDQDDVVIGTPVSRRDEPGLEPLLACLTDVLPLRQTADPCRSFSELLRSTKAAVWEAVAHRDIPFGHLVKALDTERSPARFPFFQVVLTVDDAAAPGLDLPGITSEQVRVDHGTAKFDLFFHLVPEDGGYLGLLTFTEALYDAAHARRIAQWFTTLLDSALARPDAALGELAMLSDAEYARVAEEFPEGPSVTAGLSLAHEAFSLQARITPDRPAVVDGSVEIGYAALEAASDLLARRLTALGAGPGRRVAVRLDRGPDVPTAVLAVLKSGACCVPLDPALPAERTGLVLGDSGAGILLTRSDTTGARPAAEGLRVLLLDAPNGGPEPGATALPAAGPDDLAYAVYTSGSTGVPKGVAMPHRSLANLADWQRRRSSPAPRTLQFAPIGFDVFFQELFATWAGGGTLVLAGDEARKDPALLLALAEEQRVDRLFLPFVALQQLADHAAAAGLGCPVPEVVTSGEQLHVTPAVRAFFAGTGASLDNQYGPSETHVVTAHRLAGDPAGWPARPPVGRPVQNARVEILDRAGRPVPQGAPGEIWVGGTPVAEGYLGRPEQTGLRFRPDPRVPGGLRYRTGDLARFGPDGLIEFLGRDDDQIKIRGHRVEPGEVESALRALPGVAQGAVTVVPGPAGPRLHAHFVPGPGPAAPTPGAVRTALAAVLPGYCVPSRVLAHGAFPRTATGKLDRPALDRAPAPAPAPAPTGAAAAGPASAAEPIVARAWQEVLGQPPAGPDENFFDTGGDSLLAVRLVLALRAATGTALPAHAVFGSPTPGALAARLDGAQAPEEEAPGLSADAVLPPDVRPAATVEAWIAEPRHLLLTGATGFLGAHLLYELLTRTPARVHCLVRAADPEAARARVVAALRARHLWLPAFADRVHAVPADLAAPGLGLAPGVFDELARTADAVYHCGAAVNLAHSYAQLKAANVDGTAELLRLAARHRTVALHHVSTVGVLAPGPGCGPVVHPGDPLPGPGRLRHGYAQSKWAAEKLVAQAAERGLPVTVHRPTRIAADTATGICQPSDYFWLLLRACVEAGLAPTEDPGGAVSFDLVPVDHVRSAVVALTRRPDSVGRTFHIAADERLDLGTAVGWLRGLGHRITGTTSAAWAAHVEARGLPTGLALLATVREGGAETALRYDVTPTRALLPGHLPAALTADGFAATVAHFTASGYFPAPAHGTRGYPAGLAARRRSEGGGSL
ncbi:amino acid adenylation domain-containing protein [Streptomyces sp. NPDC091371]|uniref:non-ribosomal peptide synthetase n=1 Tax=Streptomyces sp. NPDC091371 TaxID=3155303 RepID=UPI00341895C4